jgi:prepilin-type N-terminal cleavage/methylation domain-containing protein
MTHTRAQRTPAVNGRRARHGLTLIEVIVSMVILGSVLIALGLFSARLAQSTSSSRIRVEAEQLVADRLEAVKSAPRYTAIESLYVATEATIPNYPGYKRQTWVKRIGGAASDTIDYKIVTVQVTHKSLFGSLRKTTTIAPF